MLELFAMYATDGQTDRQTDGRTKAKLTASLSTGGGIITCSSTFKKMSELHLCFRYCDLSGMADGCSVTIIRGVV